jgi:putative photosynthetic complex assembly protein 2
VEYVWPVVYALLLWWFSTGLIFYLDSLPRTTFKYSMAGGTLLLIAAFVCLWRTAEDRSLVGVYAAFSSAIVVWGWQEMSLYMGFVTGTRKHRCPQGCSGLKHFGHAIAANLWHELAIIASAGVIVWLTWDASNHTGLWAFLLLWWMHLSARLNVFLGVRNVSEEFVPAHMEVLKGFLTKKPMNLLFPVSITATTALTVVLALWAAGATDEVSRTGYLLLCGLAGLGVIEHWMLMLPLPVEKLFGWSLSRKRGGEEPSEPRVMRDTTVHSVFMLEPVKRAAIWRTP